MSIKELENLVKVGQLKQEASAQAEIETHIQSGRDRLGDACAEGISLSGKFCLAIAQLTHSHWLHCESKDIGQSIDTSFFNVCLTLYPLVPIYGAYWRMPTTCAMALNMKVAMKSPKISAIRWFGAQRLWKSCFNRTIIGDSQSSEVRRKGRKPSYRTFDTQRQAQQWVHRVESEHKKSNPPRYLNRDLLLRSSRHSPSPQYLDCDA